MPTEWTYHADGVGTAVSTSHDLDGTLSSITVQLDSFRVREWEPSGADDGKDINGVDIPNSTHYDEENDVFEEYGDGAHATLKFDVSGGVAWLQSIKPEDGDVVKPKHMPLLKAAERIVTRIDGVDSGSHTIGEYTDSYEVANEIHIERLDG